MVMNLLYPTLLLVMRCEMCLRAWIQRFWGFLPTFKDAQNCYLPVLQILIALVIVKLSELFIVLCEVFDSSIGFKFSLANVKLEKAKFCFTFC